MGCGGRLRATYFHSDALGSPVATTDANRNILERSYYAPYGEALNRSIDGPGYTGHIMDAATGLVYAQQRYYDPLVGKFLSIDPVAADPGTGGNFNRYWYADNNPYRFTDPDGRIIDTIADVSFIVYDIYTLFKDPSLANAGALGADIVGAAVPFATGLGAAVRAGSHAADAGNADVARGGAAAVRVGRAGVFDIGPKELIRINDRGRIPDGLTTRVLSEVKNVRSLSFTRQLRDFSDFAQQTGRRFDLFLRPNTRVSERLQDAIDSGFIRRVDIPQ